MELNSILREMGLNEGEIKVYLALLKNGPNLAGLISRITGIHRRNVYDITDRLIQKGVIGYIVKNNRRVFEAVNPEKFLEIVKEKESLIREGLPMLKEMYSNEKEREETKFYKGANGLKNIFEDQLSGKKGSEILVLGASKSVRDILHFYFIWYTKDRVKRKIKLRMIVSEPFKKKVPLSETRYFPSEYANPVAINIYRDKVAIILWKKNQLAILIKNLEIADSYRKYFEFMWGI